VDIGRKKGSKPEKNLSPPMAKKRTKGGTGFREEKEKSWSGISTQPVKRGGWATREKKKEIHNKMVHQGGEKSHQGGKKTKKKEVKSTSEVKFRIQRQAEDRVLQGSITVVPQNWESLFNTPRGGEAEKKKGSKLGTGRAGNGSRAKAKTKRQKKTGGGALTS